MSVEFREWFRSWFFPRAQYTYWMVARFVCVIRVPVCARVSCVPRVCPGSPRCLFTGISVDGWNFIDTSR